MATTDLAGQLDRIETSLDIMNEALLGSARPGSPPGLIRRMDESERDRSDMRRRLEDITASVRTLEGTPGKTAITWWDRLGLGVMGATIAAISALVTATLKGGTP